MNKLLTLSIGLLIGVSAFSQKNKEIELNWKIGPQETLTYQTIMNEIDTSAVEFDFGNLFKAFADSSEDKTNEAKNLFKQLNESFKSIDLLTELTSNGNGTIEIVIKTRPKEEVETDESDTTDNKMAEMMKMMQSMNQGIMLRGSVYETGDIHSFWIKSNQKNLIANDQNFKCDSSYKVNKVTLTDLKKQNGETIAVIKYEIEEFVDGTFNSPAMFGSGGPTQTMMKFTHQAIAEFSIDKGRWISYDGIMGLVTSGVMTANTKKKFSLIEE